MFRKFSGVRPRTKFLTEEISKPAEDSMKIVGVEPHKYTALNKMHIHIPI